MAQAHNKTRGFTLIELLVSIVIIAIIAIAGYTGFYALSGGNEVSRNRLHAISLSQAALEEIRGIARNNFGGLAAHYAGHVNQSTQTTGFARTINIAAVPGSANLQRAEVTVVWDDKGQPRHYNTVTLISRPPDPLPGNFYGNVINAVTAERIVGARVYLTHATSGHTAVTTTATNIDCPVHPHHNATSYHFCDNAGNFQLETGNWNLQVKCESAYGCTAYLNSTVIPLFPPALASSEDRQVQDIQLEPKPEPANIIGNFVAAGTTNSVVGLAVNLRKNGSLIRSTNNNAGGFSFSNIEFSNSNPQCFTIHTLQAYKKGYCGNFCGPTGSGINPATNTKPYNYHGWSSSPVMDGTINCSNPWFGNSATDRICVSPGQTYNLGNIALSSVPLAILKGVVRLCDECGMAPIENATVSASWYDGTSWPGSATTNFSGEYSLSVPAQQELFPSGYYLRARANAPFQSFCCCTVTCTVWVSQNQDIDNIYEGNTKTADFLYNYPPMELCGNVQGKVMSGATGAKLSDVTVSVASINVTTDTNGYYIFKCPNPEPTAFRIPAGNYVVNATKTGYYSFRSSGNSIYSSVGNLSVTQFTTNTYQDIKLWPIGYGVIKGKVYHQGTTNPVIGATVQLNYYSDASIDRTATTDSNGNFEFTGVYETWPVPAVLGNSYYSQTARLHYLKFRHPDYYDTSRSALTLKSGETLDLTVEMTPTEGI